MCGIYPNPHVLKDIDFAVPHGEENIRLSCLSQGISSWRLEFCKVLGDLGCGMYEPPVRSFGQITPSSL